MCGMNRRQFLQATLATAACTAVASAETLPSPDKLILGVPLTHSDWMLKPGMQWGEAGVRHMLDACKAAGWSRVFWRVFDAGQSTYKSALLRPASHPDADNIFAPGTDEGRAAVKRLLPDLTAERGAGYLRQLATMDYGAFDSLAAAIRYGHEIGLQIHAWATINEDDHGWGWPSEFARRHPEFRWIRRDGRPYHSQLSFAFEEVRTYKLALLRELLDGYAIDGLFLDWIRTGDIRDNPQNDPAGLADYGYESPNVDAFKARFEVRPNEVAADDDRWAQVRAEPLTHFMRAARALCRERRPAGLPVSVMVGHPWHYRGAVDRIAGNLKGLLLDVAAWSREGLIDAAVAAGYYRDGGTPEQACKALREETAAGKIDVWTYAWVPRQVAEFDRDFTLARSLGASQMLLWEADYIDDRPNAAELKAAMAARAHS
jgi:hypothetical protein